nr:PD-(D/E)XK nuclease family protein [Cellulomonas hominis]
MSASTAKAIHSCPARLVGDKALPRGFDLLGAPERGTAAHLVLERLYELPPGQRDRQHAMKILTDLVLLEPGPDEVDYAAALGSDPVRYATWIASVTNAFQGIFELESPPAVEVWARELRLDRFEVAGVPFKGFVDRIDGDPDTGLKVIDYKSGKVPKLQYGDDHGDQMRLYAEALLAGLGHTVAAAQLLYIEKVVSRDVDLSPQAIDNTKRGFVRSWEDLRGYVERSAFPAKPSALCGWCPLVNSCPVARPARNPADPRGSKPSAIDLGIPTLRAGGRPEPVPVPAAAPGASAAAAAAHTSSRDAHQGAAHRSEEDPMTSRTRGAREEAKQWESTVNGELNLASYDAIGTIGLASFATELLAEREADLKVHGLAMNPATLRALTAALGRIVLAVQSDITGGSRSWAEGSNTRVRGALRSVIGARPLPIGADGATWAEWEKRVFAFTRAIVQTGIDLFDGKLAEEPLTALLPAPAAPAKAA